MSYNILRIAQWNANGLQNHKEEIKIFLLQNQIDIMLISETHFTAKSYFSIPGYRFCHTNHPDGKAHGGTAILIRCTITYSEKLQYATPELQATAIQVKGQRRPINIAAVYSPPKYNLKAPQFNSFQTLGSCFVAGGDYNCKHMLWGSRLVTTKGRELASLIYSQNYSFLSTGTPTYWPTDPNKIPDLLDFFITSKISPANADIQPSYDISSDHTPIITTLSTSIITRKQQPRLHTASTNWQTYKLEICNRVNCNWKLKNWEDLELASIKFT